MIRALTVEQVLRHSAYTRLPLEVVEQDGGARSTRNVDAIIEDTIALLGLSAIRHSAIGDEETRGISGGQRKRVNIGIELGVYLNCFALLCCRCNAVRRFFCTHTRAYRAWLHHPIRSHALVRSH